jgi:hypothetical protein
VTLRQITVRCHGRDSNSASWSGVAKAAASAILFAISLRRTRKFSKVILHYVPLLANERIC